MYIYVHIRALYMHRDMYMGMYMRICTFLRTRMFFCHAGICRGIHICAYYTYVYIHRNMPLIYAQRHVYVYVHAYLCACANAYVFFVVLAFVYEYIFAHTCMDVFVRIHPCVHVMRLKRIEIRSRTGIARKHIISELHPRHHLHLPFKEGRPLISSRSWRV
jgi:hypothetical protein